MGAVMLIFGMVIMSRRGFPSVVVVADLAGVAAVVADLISGVLPVGEVAEINAGFFTAKTYGLGKYCGNVSDNNWCQTLPLAIQEMLFQNSAIAAKTANKTINGKKGLTVLPNVFFLRFLPVLSINIQIQVMGQKRDH
jgi:hypothetical protein